MFFFNTLVGISVIVKIWAIVNGFLCIHSIAIESIEFRNIGSHIGNILLYCHNSFTILKGMHCEKTQAKNPFKVPR